eukprot:TRINITY_DN3134_c0_g1_i2.p1 TRINITY_DN3134_c0_g1~~TRINITY_DN3134_c0_g1_i2.p1  ORF type:complete len:801 (-),score=164.50 TRINITY_DN3134_c0_g1_i2:717-3119(-)
MPPPTGSCCRIFSSACKAGRSCRYRWTRYSKAVAGAAYFPMRRTLHGSSRAAMLCLACAVCDKPQVIEDVVAISVAEFARRPNAAADTLAAIARLPEQQLLAIIRGDSGRGEAAGKRACTVSRMLCVLCETHVLTVLASPALAAHYIRLLMACSSSPIRESVENALGFWNEVHLLAQGTDPDARAVAQQLSGTLVELSAVLALQCIPPHLPPSTTWDQDEQERFAAFRSNIGNTLLQLLEVAGLGCVSRILDALLDPASHSGCVCNAVQCGCGSEWRRCEGAVFCLASVADALDTVQAERLLPQLLGWLRGVAPQLQARPPALTLGVLSLLAQYAQWMSRSPEFALFAVDLCLSLLRDGVAAAATRPGQAQNAATAFLKLVEREEVAQLLAPQCGALVDFCDATAAAATAAALPLRTQYHLRLPVTEALCEVLRAADPAAVAPTLERVLGPLRSWLEDLVNRAAATITNTNGSDDVAELQEATVLVLYLMKAAAKRLDWSIASDATHPLLLHFARDFPLAMRAAEAHNWCEPVVRCACQYTRSAVLSLHSHVLPLLSDLLNALCALFERTGGAEPLGAVGVATSIFRDSTVTPVAPTAAARRECMSAALERLTRRYSAQLASCQLARLKPDTVKEFFQLASQFLEYQTTVTLSSAALPELMSSVALSLATPQRNTLVSTLRFLSLFARTCSARPERLQLLLTFGASITNTLVVALTTSLSRTLAPAVAEVLFALQNAVPNELRQWLCAAVNAAQRGPHLTQVVRDKFVNGVMVARNKTEVGTAVNDYMTQSRGLPLGFQP